jgi:glycine cleavage system protein P-like pyridoxal-binding family
MAGMKVVLQNIRKRNIDIDDLRKALHKDNFCLMVTTRLPRCFESAIKEITN